jgi:sugar phosphate isomerase/epimerase
MHHTPINRRSFLQGAAAGGAALGLGLGLNGSILRAGEVTGNPKPGKVGPFKISLAEWSLHRALRSGKLDNLDFPKVAREQYGIEGVEYVNQFFKDKAHDSVYLKDLKKRAADNGVTNVLIMIDGEGDLSAPDKAARDKAIDNHKKWVDAAVALGCHAVRINTGGHYSPTDVADVAEACSALTEYGAQNKIHVICENHGGPSSNPDALLALMKAVNGGKTVATSANFGTLPDFGNFPQEGGKYTIDVYDAIARMMPYAYGVSAKSYDFDDKGRETKLDFARIMKIVTDSGYDGWVGIEYEGGRLGEPEGIKATKALLEAIKADGYTG